MILSEYHLIDQIQRLVSTNDPRVICGIGDDCAVVHGRRGYLYLFTTDCVVQGVHFKFESLTFRDSGWKAVATGLSDIAAMGGRPLFILVSLGIPEFMAEKDILEVYEGMREVSSLFNVSVIGGNLSRDPRSFWIHITTVGEVRERNVKYRRGAKEGDLVFVTGTLGASAMGQRLLAMNPHETSPNSLRHKRPMPRIKEGFFLGGMPQVTSLIDISDGLVRDLGHILRSSGVGAVIESDAVPREGLLPLDLVLQGGEDYELLFTVRSKKRDDFLMKASEAGFWFSKIGVIVSKDEGLKILDKEGNEIKGIGTGYDHFTT